jgi:hypothetical protein
VSRADAPAAVISQQVITTTGEQPPFPFSLPYDPAQIDERYTYAMQARIESDGQLLFINTESYPVITKGNPTEVEVVVQRVGEAPAEAPAETPAAAPTEAPAAEAAEAPAAEAAAPAQMPTTGGAPSLALVLLAVAGTLLAGAGLQWLGQLTQR